MSVLSDKLRKLVRPFCTMVVVAAGESTRMGEDKLFLEFGGKTVLARTLLALENCDAVDEILIVTRPDRVEDCAALGRSLILSKAHKVLIGGQTRSQSALAGVTEASTNAGLIGIHDGARPLVTPQLVSEVVNRAYRFGAAAPGVGIKDTVKLTENGIITETLPRDALVAIQTPQVFQADLIKCALTSAVQKKQAFTDDCAAVEAIGGTIQIVPGDPDNIKLTDPYDLETAERILRRRGEWL